MRGMLRYQLLLFSAPTKNMFWANTDRKEAVQAAPGCFKLQTSTLMEEEEAPALENWQAAVQRGVVLCS